MSLVTSKTGRPPGPKGSGIGVNLGEFRANVLGFLRRLARDYDPLASFRLGPRRIFLASGHDLIEQVLVHDAKCLGPVKLCHCFLSGMGVFDGSEPAVR